MKVRNCYNPIIDDIRRQYKHYRATGKNRFEAIAAIESSYAEELQDDDDYAAVQIGIALSLCQKKELTTEIAERALCAVHRAQKSIVLDKAKGQYLSQITQLLGDTSLIGSEATYQRRVPYVPDWQTGDLFSHTLTYPTARLLGIEGWSILFYKVGEFVEDMHHYRQLVYVSLCEPGSEPATSLQLQNLGFLRMMNHDRKWDYLAQLTFKSKKEEQSYDLVKIGNFPDVMLPSDRTEEDPLCAMPLFGYLKKGDAWPDYEDQICRIFRKYGKIHD